MILERLTCLPTDRWLTSLADTGIAASEARARVLVSLSNLLSESTEMEDRRHLAAIEGHIDRLFNQLRQLFEQQTLFGEQERVLKAMAEVTFLAGNFPDEHKEAICAAAMADLFARHFALKPKGENFPSTTLTYCAACYLNHLGHDKKIRTLYEDTLSAWHRDLAGHGKWLGLPAATAWERLGILLQAETSPLPDRWLQTAIRHYLYDLPGHIGCTADGQTYAAFTDTARMSFLPLPANHLHEIEKTLLPGYHSATSPAARQVLHSCIIALSCQRLSNELQADICLEAV